jgi:hypothetical protein
MRGDDGPTCSLVGGPDGTSLRLLSLMIEKREIAPTAYKQSLPFVECEAYAVARCRF